MSQLAERVETVLTQNSIGGIKFIVVVDSDIPELADCDLLWWTLAAVDIARDFAFVQHDVALFDARRKNGGLNGANRRWPNPTVTDQATIDKVDKLWAKLSLGEFISSPSNYYGQLSRGTGSDSE